MLANAAFFALVAGVVFSVLGYLAMPAILGLILKRSPGAYAAALTYLHWRLLGVTSMATTFAFKAFFDGIGKTHVHLVSAVVMNVLNVVLCYLLIFGGPGARRSRGWASRARASPASSRPTSASSIMIGYALLPEYRRRFHPFSPKKLVARAHVAHPQASPSRARRDHRRHGAASTSSR